MALSYVELFCAVFCCFSQMCWSFERLRVVREYRTPRSIRSFTKMVIFILPLVLSPYFVYVGENVSFPETHVTVSQPGLTAYHQCCVYLRVLHTSSHCVPPAIAYLQPLHVSSHCIPLAIACLQPLNASSHCIHNFGLKRHECVRCCSSHILEIKDRFMAILRGVFYIKHK